MPDAGLGDQLRRDESDQVLPHFSCREFGRTLHDSLLQDHEGNRHTFQGGKPGLQLFGILFSFTNALVTPPRIFWHQIWPFRALFGEPFSLSINIKFWKGRRIISGGESSRQRCVDSCHKSLPRGSVSGRYENIHNVSGGRWITCHFSSLQSS